MTLKCYKFEFSGNFAGFRFSQVWAATAAKRTKITKFYLPYHELFLTVFYARAFIRSFTCTLILCRCVLSFCVINECLYKIDQILSATSCTVYPLNVLFTIVLLALVCRRFLCSCPSYTHCCRALTLALARLSCKIA